MAAGGDDGPKLDPAIDPTLATCLRCILRVDWCRCRYRRRRRGDVPR